MTRAQPRPPFPKKSVYGGLIVFGLLLLLFWTTDWDRSVAAGFYGESPPWPGLHLAWCEGLYRFGQLPATLSGLLGGLAFGLSFAQPRWRRWRGPGLFLFLLLALGPGLLVNGLTKALAGRPRPEETFGFGGLWAFRRPFELGIPGQGQSLISGHAANAFYFFGLLWLLRPAYRFFAFVAVCVVGGAMAWTRAAQGAHWISDGLLAGALLYTLAAALSPLIHWQPSRAFFRKPELRWALLLGVLAWLLIGHVRYEDRRFAAYLRSPGPLPPQARPLLWLGAAMPSDVAVDLELPESDLRVRFDQVPELGRLPFALNAQFRGQGLPGAREDLVCRPLTPGGPLELTAQSLAYRVEERLNGLWFSSHGDLDLALPRDLGVDARLRLPQGRLTIAPLPAGRRVLISHLPREAAPPGGFKPFGTSAWLRDGADPLIALDLQAASVRFEE